MQRFDGRVAMVTGAAHGVGRAVAARLQAEGASVALLDLDGDALRAVVDELAADSGDARLFPVVGDITDGGSVDDAVAATVEHFGALDILVNNAGGAIGPDAGEFDEARWQMVTDLNLMGSVRCIDAALPHLLTSRVGGNVVSVGSVNGLAAIGSLAYSAAKAGLENLTQNLAVQYGARSLREAGTADGSVRFNLVAPGTVRTRVWEGPRMRELLERRRSWYPLDRVGEPEDIAAAVAFLGSDDAAWITGVTLPVDGGLLAGPAATVPRDG